VSTTISRSHSSSGAMATTCTSSPARNGEVARRVVQRARNGNCRWPAR
jgi:hypothetical protein